MSAPGAVNKKSLFDIKSKCCLFVKFVFVFLIKLALIDKTIGVLVGLQCFKSLYLFKKNILSLKFSIT